MALFDKVKNFVFEDEYEEDDVQDPVDGIADSTWNSCLELKNNIWQKAYALSVVKNILTTFLSDVEWKTYKGSSLVKGDEWFRFNIAPNRKETAPEFYGKLATKLIYEHRALIIETATKEFFVADNYNFKGGKELLMKDNVFTDVTIGDITLNRTFKENDTCMYIKAPQNDNVDAIFSSMASDFQTLKDLISEGADKALGMKLSLTLSAQAKNKYDKKTLRAIQEVYQPLMSSRNAVFITYKGEELADLTERQRGSEVQQVLEAVENNIKVNDEILCNVGMAYGIPKKMMTGEYNTDNGDVYPMAITMFAKPIFNILSKKFTYFILTKEDVLNGSRVFADLSSIKFIDPLTLAGAVDKLIGSGAYTINEVREKVGDDPVEDGDIRFITKNYAVMSEYTKGENGNEI